MTASVDGPISVLYVDGDADQQDRVVAGLEDGGGDLAVTAVATGEDAISRFDAGAFDCLVSEYALPDTDGLTVLERVRERDGTVPFVLYTDAGDERVASDAFSAGATDYLRKDGTDQGDLTAAIEAAVDEYRTERALEESEERYRTLVEGSHDGIYIYQDAEFVFVNDRICEITGYSEAELADMEIWELVHPADRDRVRAIGERRARGENPPQTYDSRILTKDGETRYLEFSVASITHEGNWAALGSVRDVTEHRERERELRAEQEFVRTILDTLDDVIFVSSLDGEILRWNDRLCDVTGYSDDELADMVVFDIVPEEYETDMVGVIRDVLSTGTASVEGEALTRTGERIPFEFRGSELQNSEGEVIGVAGVARDVSERRAREQELAQYRTIVEAVGDPVYTLDTDGNFTLVNEALAEMTGHEGDELVGEHVSTVMRDQDVETATELIEELLKSDERRNATFEMQTVTAEGDRVSCEDHIALLPSKEGFQGTAGVVRDITDRKEREETLRRQNERLDQFAGVVSHDLRNPLNVMLSRLELARQSGDEEHFAAIEAAGERMERLIDDLLTLARDGQTVGEVEPVALGPAVESAWKNVETTAATLSVQADDAQFLADSDRLASLLENLFRNAVEHGSTSPDSQTRQDAVEHGSTSNRISSDDAVEHGSTSPDSQTRQDAVEHGSTGDRTATRSKRPTDPCAPGSEAGLSGSGGGPAEAAEQRSESVRVRVGRIESTGTTGFYVADDGPGIPPSERADVFQHGYSNSENGTGLGLVIVEGIAEAHDWSVSVTESETGGARFEVTGVEPFGG
ncbi:PAS domain S-box protein [Halorientalis salina]|uniref:PAS domain S-box protein n=1 Tax=Halorientalis salina TaxID=2932266 RepID=UPI0010AC405F|nr:PAS domain S-box protein [Halorientalis salina]